MRLGGAQLQQALGQPQALARLGSSGGSPYSVQANALFARMTTPPTPARKVLINTFIVALINAGVWSRLDIMYVPAAADSQAATLNWLANTFTLVPVNSPTFTVDRGYAGDGASSYVDTTWVPSTNGVNFTLNSGTIGSYLNAGTNTGANTAVSLGSGDASNRTLINPFGASPAKIRARINSGTTADSTGSAASRLGLTSISRRDASNISFYRNGALDSAVASASAGVPAGNLFIGGLSTLTVPSNLVDNRTAFAFAGAGFTDAENLAIYNAAIAYLTAVGAN